LFCKKTWFLQKINHILTEETVPVPRNVKCMMSAAAPEGTPRRWIGDCYQYKNQYEKNFPAVPCLGGALKRGTLQKMVPFFL